MFSCPTGPVNYYSDLRELRMTDPCRNLSSKQLRSLMPQALLMTRDSRLLNPSILPDIT